MTIGEALLAPHRSYLPVIRPLLASGAIKGMAHITGGGITENLPRVLPPGTHAVVDRSAWRVPALFAVAAAGRRGARRRHAADVQHGHRA